jgi:hypothetical protein
MQINTTSAAQANSQYWAARLQSTPPGRIRLNSTRGEVEYATASLTPAQIASLQATQTEYGDTIEWHTHGDEDLKEGRPSPWTACWTDTTTGRTHAATWDTKGRVANHRVSR